MDAGAQLIAVVDGDGAISTAKSPSVDASGAELLVLAALDAFDAIASSEAPVFGFLGMHCIATQPFFLFGLEAGLGARIVVAFAEQPPAAVPHELSLRAQRCLLGEKLNPFGVAPSRAAPRLSARLAALLG